jgi:putative sigma-54 modulation protein
MKIEYFARNLTIDDGIRHYVEEKLKKLAKFLADPEAAVAHVTVEKEKHHFIVEVQVHDRFGALVAKETADQVLDAVNLAVDKVETQAERARKKHKERRRRAQRQETNGNHWPEEVIARESLTPGGGRQELRIVETTRLQIKPMSIDEAALQLEDDDRLFVVFRDMDTDRLSVLYKRRDENYGLIAPEL